MMLSAPINTLDAMENNVNPYSIKKNYRIISHKYDIEKLLARPERVHSDFKKIGVGEFWFDVWDAYIDSQRATQKRIEEKATINMRTFEIAVLTPSLGFFGFAPSLEQDTHALKPFWSSVSVTKPQSLREKINTAITEDDVVRITNQAGFDHVETHIVYLHKLMAEDGDDYSVPLESLKNFALFLIDHPKILSSQVGVTPDSFVNVIWDTPDRTITLFMEFLPANQIRFTVMKHDDVTADNPQFFGDKVSSETIMEHIEPIISPRLVI